MKHLHGTEGDEACRVRGAEGRQLRGCVPRHCLCCCLSVPQSVCFQSIRLLVCLSFSLSPCPSVSLFPLLSPRLSAFYAKLQSPQMLSDHNRSRIWGRGGKGTSYSQSSQSRLYNIIMFIYLSDLFTQDLHRICPTLSCAQ